MRRRDFIASTALGLTLSGTTKASAQRPDGNTINTGRLRFGAFASVFGRNRSIEECCQDAVKLGIQGLENIPPSDWPTLHKYGLIPSLSIVGGFSGGAPGTNAIAWPEAQGEYLKQYQAAIDVAAENHVPNMVLLAGSRSTAFTDQQGADNAVAFCNQLKAHAEDKGINLCMEINNSKGQYSSKSSIFDNMAWGLDVIKRVNSPRVKIMYDCFHAQLTEGNIVQTIRDNIQYIGHIHVGGVPGRHQPDETQELNYHFIAQAIADLNYTGWVSHEWIPSPGSDPFATLQNALAIMKV